MPTGIYLWPENPGLSLAFWAALIVLAMFGARTPAHQAIHGLGRAVAHWCRLAAHAVTHLQERVAARNREVLLSEGMQITERQIEQEFRRVTATVDRDLGGYPALHRRLAEQITRIDEDYRHSIDAPLEPESWAHAVEVATELVGRTELGGAAAKAVNALNEGLREAHGASVTEYRKASRQRHELLARMAPVWRHMDATLSRVDRAVASIFERARHIDQLMVKYREIADATPQAEQILSASALTQFCIAGFVLVVASLGGFINFQLIALPMSEMVGATSRLGGIPTSDVAALVIIMVEITMGLFLMETLRITRLFPVIGSLDDRTRRRMAWVVFGILVTLAGIESSLAYMRDMLAADRAALTQTLAGGPVERPEFMWIPAVGQMVMGFILPFALTFVAVPLESFVHSARTVGGNLAAGSLRTVAFLLHLGSSLVKSVAGALANIYDVVIFGPLKIEEWLMSGRRGPSVDAVEPERRAPVL